MGDRVLTPEEEEIMNAMSRLWTASEGPSYPGRQQVIKRTVRELSGKLKRYFCGR